MLVLLTNCIRSQAITPDSSLYYVFYINSLVIQAELQQ